MATRQPIGNTLLAPSATQPEQPLTRDRLSTFVLIALTVLGVAGCVLMAAPFIPAIAWSLALAVVAHPLHAWIGRRIGSPTLAAAAATLIVAVCLLAPIVLLVREIGLEVTSGIKTVQQGFESGQLTAKLEENPTFAAAFNWARTNMDIDRELRSLGDALRSHAGGWLQGTISTMMQLAITIFLLFFLFRDHKPAIRTAKALLPLSEREASEIVGRIGSTIHATIYGTVAVASIQGLLGGLMFWILGLPAPLLWGVAMGLLSIIPMFGAFIIWIPAAMGLAVHGDWTKAIILTVWGSVVIGLIDNVLYPALVGKELRLHTVPVFIAIVGGLTLFGAAGLVLGPVTLAVTLACVDILRRRTAGGRSAQQPS